MRIIHFSDTHFATLPENLWACLFDKRILGLMNYVTRRRHTMHKHREDIKAAVQSIQRLDPDAVVCSGDVTVIGSAREFAGARERLAPLVESSQFEFIYVPGNHDAYSKAAGCRRALRDAFHYLNRGCWQLEDMPQELRLGSVRFFVVNENRPTNIFLSTGYLQGNARVRLDSWLSEERAAHEVRILVGHHPTRLADGRLPARRRRFVGGDRVQDALLNGELDLSLCGHIHDPFRREFSGGRMEVCAGSLSANGVMVMIDIDESTGEIDAVLLRPDGSVLEWPSAQ